MSRPGSGLSRAWPRDRFRVRGGIHSSPRVGESCPSVQVQTSSPTRHAHDVAPRSHGGTWKSRSAPSFARCVASGPGRRRAIREFPCPPGPGRRRPDRHEHVMCARGRRRGPRDRPGAAAAGGDDRRVRHAAEGSSPPRPRGRNTRRAGHPRQPRTAWRVVWAMVMGRLLPCSCSAPLRASAIDPPFYLSACNGNFESLAA